MGCSWLGQVLDVSRRVEVLRSVKPVNRGDQVELQECEILAGQKSTCVSVGMCVTEYRFLDYVHLLRILYGCALGAL